VKKRKDGKAAVKGDGARSLRDAKKCVMKRSGEEGEGSWKLKEGGKGGQTTAVDRGTGRS